MARDVNAIERIREHIQGVSRGALPMGRLLDLLYEDLDSMLTELSSWKQEYNRCNRDIERAMRLATIARKLAATIAAKVVLLQRYYCCSNSCGIRDQQH